MAEYIYIRDGESVGFEDMNGKVIDSISGLEIGSDDVTIKMTDGTVYRMLHHQDCCERVDINDVVGDIYDIVGSTVIDARCDSRSGGDHGEYDSCSFTWTFYNIQTSNGHVQIKWYGASNGYYSESVDFYKMKNHI